MSVLIFSLVMGVMLTLFALWFDYKGEGMLAEIAGEIAGGLGALFLLWPLLFFLLSFGG
jgi:hypothetical protein